MDLPLEILLVIAEYSAWTSTWDRKDWVTDLSLVARAFRTVADPILYHCIIINARTYLRLSRAVFSGVPGFAQTRVVLLQMHVGLASAGINTQLAKAFAHVTYVSGLPSAVRDFLSEYPAPTPRAVSMAATPQRPWAYTLRPETSLRLCTHLHLLLQPGRWDRSHPPMLLELKALTHFALDIKAGTEAPARIYDAFAPCLPPTVQRFLFRTRRVVSDEFGLLLAQVARERQDPRLWLDPGQRDIGWHERQQSDIDRVRLGLGMWECVGIPVPSELPASTWSRTAFPDYLYFRTISSAVRLIPRPARNLRAVVEPQTAVASLARNVRKQSAEWPYTASFRLIVMQWYKIGSTTALNARQTSVKAATQRFLESRTPSHAENSAMSSDISGGKSIIDAGALDLVKPKWRSLAARSQISEGKREVCKLVAVSRTFKAAVQPVLYEFVRITHTNLGSILRTARSLQSPFSLTRRLIIQGPIAHTDRPLVAAAFAHVRHFVGLAEELIALFQHAEVHPTALYIRHELAMEPWVDSLLPRLRHSCTHLHLVFFSNPLLSFPFTISRFCDTLGELEALQVLVLTITDPFVALQDASAGTVRALVDALSQRKESSRLHVRCFHLNREFYNRSIVKLVRAAAMGRRDCSVSIEEYFLMDEGRDWMESAPVEDWTMNGRQIYDPDADGQT
ncbi:hypothetical protein AURDEDRAFT_149680 [Auricularia subglabra TFB-10046 SS5]|nr:hypothetical protein AURDEDRAFT_149680 [Auricularia subglabra TFB-10046 SS5]